MHKRKVILTWEAIYDITDIADYIERNFGQKRANKFQQDIRKQIEDIGYMGGIISKTHIHYRSYSIFKKSFSPSIIFYVVKESKNEIHILRVLREERDWAGILNKNQDYTYPEQMR